MFAQTIPALAAALLDRNSIDAINTAVADVVRDLEALVPPTVAATPAEPVA